MEYLKYRLYIIVLSNSYFYKISSTWNSLGPVNSIQGTKSIVGEDTYQWVPLAADILRTDLGPVSI